MSDQTTTDSNGPTPYGSAADLPSFRELSQQIAGGKLLTRLFFRRFYAELVEIEQQLANLTHVVDAFYDRLGSLNWIFHESLNLGDVERILGEASDADTTEKRLIELYRASELGDWKLMGLRSHEGMLRRFHQIERAREHYQASQYDSCVLHLIAVMDGFVNDFEPSNRKGLHARDPLQMVAWDSIVGHHQGFTHALVTFKKTIKRRVDEEVFDVYRNGIMHGTVVNFNNPVVATKAWNMLFAVSDWATATDNAKQPPEPKPTFRDTWPVLSRRAIYRRHQREFVTVTVQATDAGFASDEVAQSASGFLDAWENRRWGLVARFRTPMQQGSESGGRAIEETKERFRRYDLQNWAITSVVHDHPSAAEINAEATVNNRDRQLQFRLGLLTIEGHMALRGETDVRWYVVSWFPHTYIQNPQRPAP